MFGIYLNPVNSSIDFIHFSSISSWLSEYSINFPIFIIILPVKGIHLGLSVPTIPIGKMLHFVAFASPMKPFVIV